VDTLAFVTITKDGHGLSRTYASTRGFRELGVQQLIISGVAIDHELLTARGVRLFHRRPRGIVEAFNFGVRGANAEWVWFLNGGDAVHEDLDPAWLLTLLTKTQADLIVGTIHRDGEATPVKLPPLSEQWPILRSWPPHPAVIVRRNLLEAVGGFDERWRIAMDFDLWQRIIGRDVVVDVVSMPFARFDVTGMSERPEMRRNLWREEARVLLRHSGQIAGHFAHRAFHFLRRLGWAMKNRW
jgi:hypothetical protein